MIQNIINHIAFVIDASSSMKDHAKDVVKVFDGEIATLAKRSKELDQETRVSVYLFADTVSCLIYDMDVMRLPSLAAHYKAYGNTALIDGTCKAINDLRLTPQLYADHAFLIYALTDGEENRSEKTERDLILTLENLQENWSVGVLVPNARGVDYAKRTGFPAANIQEWDIRAGGVKGVGKSIRTSTENFMLGRAKGIRGTRNMFQLDTSTLSTTALKATLVHLKRDEFDLINVPKDVDIKTFCTRKTGEYRVGSAFYELTKAETIQEYKEICVMNNTTGQVFSGDNARKVIGLPNKTIKLKPDDDLYTNFSIFVQSTSSNRKLIGGTRLIILA